MKNIAAALIKAKKAFSPALKDKTNPAFRSKYADLGACLEAVNDALLDNGIALFQETFEDQGGGVTVQTVLLHESGETIHSGKLHLPATKQDAQGYGSALTYARRYSLMSVCGIAPEDDDGNAAVKAKHQAATSMVPELEAAIEHERQKKQGVMDAVLRDIDLDPATRNGLTKLAARIAPMSPPEAFDVIEDNGLDADEKTFLWSMIDSKMRNALKKEREKRQLLAMREEV